MPRGRTESGRFLLTFRACSCKYRICSAMTVSLLQALARMNSSACREEDTLRQTSSGQASPVAPRPLRTHIWMSKTAFLLLGCGGGGEGERRAACGQCPAAPPRRRVASCAGGRGRPRGKERAALRNRHQDLLSPSPLTTVTNSSSSNE